jgi:hypothetical protein
MMAAVPAVHAVVATVILMMSSEHEAFSKSYLMLS